MTCSSCCSLSYHSSRPFSPRHSLNVFSANKSSRDDTCCFNGHNTNFFSRNFYPQVHSLITKLLSNKQNTYNQMVVSQHCSHWMLGGNLKMIYANVISLGVIQHSKLMTELLQPNYKLTSQDIIARLMCFSGTCLIARRLRWGLCRCLIPTCYGVS